MEKKLEVKFDKTEYEVVVNGVECDYCGEKDFGEFMQFIQDVSICEGCYDHFN